MLHSRAYSGSDPNCWSSAWHAVSAATWRALVTSTRNPAAVLYTRPETPVRCATSRIEAGIAAPGGLGGGGRGVGAGLPKSDRNPQLNKSATADKNPRKFARFS